MANFPNGQNKVNFGFADFAKSSSPVGIIFSGAPTTQTAKQEPGEQK